MIKISTAKDEAAHRAIITESLDQVFDLHEKFENDEFQLSQQALSKLNSSHKIVKQIKSVIAVKKNLLTQFNDDMSLLEDKKEEVDKENDELRRKIKILQK